MRRLTLSSLPQAGLGAEARWRWVVDNFNRIALASRIDDSTAATAAGTGTGDVVGPASATANNPAVFDGATGKLIKELTYAAFKALLVLVKGDVGLGNVDNTSDANKPVSTATQTALDLKANLASPALTGIPTAPTQDEDDDSTAIATTEYVDRAVEDVLVDTVLTGSATAVTLDVSDNSDAVATTAFVHKVVDALGRFDPWQVATVPASSYQWGAGPRAYQ